MSTPEDKAINEVCDELAHGRFCSTHHGHGVILEELQELFEEIRGRRADVGTPDQYARMRHEAMQVASSAIRFMVDPA